MMHHGDGPAAALATKISQVGGAVSSLVVANYVQQIQNGFIDKDLL